jgi:hypothetical protein
VTGRITPIRAYALSARDTTISIPFEPNGSAFVVFAGRASANRLMDVTLNGVTVLENGVYSQLQPGGDPAINLANGDLRESGTYVLTTADGHSREFEVDSPVGLEVVKGPWQIRFPAGQAAPLEITLDSLTSWSVDPNNGVRYFSGTATYFKTLAISEGKPDRRLTLDLGRVEVMARVRLNGKDLGILWKPPYCVDITGAARTGDNKLEIEVVNLWVNRLIGDEQLPEDSERNPNGTVKVWPAWLREGKPSPTGRQTFSSWRLWKADDPLQDSGLLGPVTLRSSVIVPP